MTFLSNRRTFQLSMAKICKSWISLLGITNHQIKTNVCYNQNVEWSTAYNVANNKASKTLYMGLFKMFCSVWLLDKRWTDFPPPYCPFSAPQFCVQLYRQISFGVVLGALCAEICGTGMLHCSKLSSYLRVWWGVGLAVAEPPRCRWRALGRTTQST